MDPRRFELLRELFESALALPPEARRAHLVERAAGDLSLAEEILDLLRRHAAGDESVLRLIRAELPPALKGGADSPRVSASEKKLASLRSRPSQADLRYRTGEEIGRGAMGAVLRVRDLDLGRDLAMKVILDARQGSSADSESSSHTQIVQRFLDEAQITGQLDHPGVVPVHDLGIDASGRVYFTMRLIKGDTADVVFAAARAGEAGWTLTRALEVILKVCDTMAFAHDKGVLHRDLKPSNVMVGKFGEVYVVDWGLAKARGQADRHDLRLRPQSATASKVRTDRSTEEADSDSPLVTMDGTVMGTPSYMALEQAEGRIELLDQRADVYAVGAMLYELLTGHRPYVTPGARVSSRTILAAVQAGPPTPISTLDRSVPPELVAVCEKAMARKLDHRYPDMRSLAEDLRAYLDHRVVAAYRTGPLAELTKWMRRNRTAAAGIAVAGLAILGAGTLVAVNMAEAAVIRADAASARAREADAQTKEAQANAKALAAEVQALKDREQKTLMETEAHRRKVADRVGRARADDFNRRAAMQREVVGTIDRLQLADNQIVQLAQVVADDTPEAGDAARPIDSLDRYASDLAAGTQQDWRPWALGRWLTIRGRPGATEVLEKAVPSKEQLDKANPKAPLQLVMGTLHRALGDAHSGQGELGAALQDYLTAIATYRTAAASMGLDSPDRRPEGLTRLAIVTARDGARLLLNAKPQVQPQLRQQLNTWLDEQKGDNRRAPANITPGPELGLLRVAEHLAGGDLDKALTELDKLPDPAAQADLRALALVRQGHVSQALAALLDPTIESDLPVKQQHAFAVQKARCLLAAHRVHEAMDEIDLDLSVLQRSDYFPQLRRESLQVRAELQADLGDLTGAGQSLELAGALAPTKDNATQELLRLQRAHLLSRLGRPADALASYVGRSLTGKDGDLDNLSIAALYRIALLGERGGQPGLVAPALGRLASIRSRSNSDRMRVLLVQSVALRGAGQVAEADTADAELLRNAPYVTADVAMLTAMHLARVQTDAGRPRDALAQLSLAADATTNRLVAYSRLQSTARGSLATGGVHATTFGEEAQSVVDSLARLVGDLGDDDLPTACAILQSCTNLEVRRVLTRPPVMPTDYERARTDLLSNHWRRLARDIDDESIATSSLAKELSRKEDQLRERGAVYAAAFPRVPSLAQVQKELGAATALVTFVPAVPNALALVVTRSAAAITPLPATDALRSDWPSLSDEDLRRALDGLGAAWLEPVLRSTPFATSASIHTIVLAPLGSLAALPLEWCTVVDSDQPDAPRQALLARYDVAFAPSATAWFDQARSQRRSSSRGGEQCFALLDTTRDAEASLAWTRASFARLLSNSRDKTLLQQLGTTASDPAARQGAQLRTWLDGDVRESDWATAWAKEGPKCRAVVWSLPLRGSDQNPATSWLECGPRAAPYDGRLTLQDARDLGSTPELVLVRNSAGSAEPTGEAQALAAFAQALWSGGASVVVTVTGSASSTGAPAVDALLRVRPGGADGLSAWCETLRDELRRGRPVKELMGVRPWLVPR